MMKTLIHFLLAAVMSSCMAADGPFLFIQERAGAPSIPHRVSPTTGAIPFITTGNVMSTTPSVTFGRALLNIGSAAAARSTVMPAYAGQAGKYLKVNNAETDMEYSTVTATASADTLTGTTLAATVTASSLLSAAGGTFGSAAFANTSAFEVPITAGTGLTRTANTLTVNTTQSVTRLSSLTSNGLVRAVDGNGTLTVDTTPYATLDNLATMAPLSEPEFSQAISVLDQNDPVDPGTELNGIMIISNREGLTSIEQAIHFGNGAHVGSLYAPVLSSNYQWRLPQGTGTVMLDTDGSGGISAARLTSGDVAVERLGSGTASSTTYLRGDKTWQTISSGITIGATTSNGTAGRPLYTDGTYVQAYDTIPVAHGGTNLASYTVGDLLYASGTTTIAKLADVATGQVLVSGGVGVAPSYSSTPTITGTNITGIPPAGIIGTGAVLTGNVFIGANTVNLTSLGSTTTPGLILANTTSATNGTTQHSPAVKLTSGLYTSGGAVSLNYNIVVKPQQIATTLPFPGGTTNLGYLQIVPDVNGSLNNIRNGYANYNDLKFDAHGTLWLNSFVGRQIIMGGTPEGGTGSVMLHAANGFIFHKQMPVAWVNGFDAVNGTPDTYIYRGGVATVELGYDVATGSAADYTIKGSDGVTGTNVSGADVTIASGDTTGNATSAVIIKVPTAGASGTTARTAAEIARFTSAGLSIGGTTAIAGMPSSVATLDFDLSAVTTQDLTVTVTGAAVGDVALPGVPVGSVTTTSAYTAFVSATNTVTIRCTTLAVGENPASGSFRATVIKQ